MSVRAKQTLTKNLVTDQTWTNITKKLNVANITFDATEGMGYGAASTSTIALIMVGGFNDQKITATMKYVDPTTDAGSDLGVMLRVISADSPNTAYYYIRYDGGQARITKVLESGFQNLTSSPFTVTKNTVFTIEAQVVGTALSATFTSGTSVVNLSTIDSNIASGGVMGLRSFSSTGWFRNFTVEEL